MSEKTSDDLISELDAFTEGFLECLFWSETNYTEDGEGDENFQDYCFSDLDVAGLAQIIQECAEFQEAHEEMLAKAGDDSQNGHDFCLTRNGHGAGFWDRGYYGTLGDDLSDACKPYGTCGLMLGDDGKLYTHG